MEINVLEGTSKNLLPPSLNLQTPHSRAPITQCRQARLVRLSGARTQDCRLGRPIGEHRQAHRLSVPGGLLDALLPRSEGAKGGRPPYPTEVMVRILVLKRLYNLSDEQVGYQLLDRMSFQRFCHLTGSARIPDRNTIWLFQQRIGTDGALIVFQGVDTQLHRHGYMARSGQAIDATLVNAPIQHLSKQDKAQLDAGKTPSDWSEAKRRQKDLDATRVEALYAPEMFGEAPNATMQVKP